MKAVFRVPEHRFLSFRGTGPSQWSRDSRWERFQAVCRTAVNLRPPGNVVLQVRNLLGLFHFYPNYKEPG
jgi:hypothetical protein